MGEKSVAIWGMVLLVAAMTGGCGLIKSDSDQFVGEYSPKLMPDEKGGWKIEPGLVSGNEVCILSFSRNVQCDESMTRPSTTGVDEDGIVVGKRTVYLARGERYRVVGNIGKKSREGNEVLIRFNVSKIGKYSDKTTPSAGSQADISFRMENVLIQQTCKHTKTIRPGVLLISGDIILRNNAASPTKIKDLVGVIINGREKGPCMIYEKNRQRADQPPPPVKNLKIPAGGEAYLVFGGSVSTPPFELKLDIEHIGSFSLEELEHLEDSFGVTMLEEPVSWDNAAEIDGRQWFGTRFRFKLKNNTNCTWVFDAADAFQPTDLRDQKFILLKDSEGCPEVRLEPEEEKELQFEFLTMDKPINPIMRFGNPVNLVQ